jgi:hypothetical protein
MPTKGNPGQSEAEPGEEVIHLQVEKLFTLWFLV